MAYSADISALGADHHWKFDGNSTDAIGTASGTDTTMSYTSSPIAEDATNSALMDVRTDSISIPTTTTINNSAQARKAVGGWFMVDAFELPHCRIYGEGDNTTNFQLVLFAGNSVMLEIRDSTTWQVQVYSDIAIQTSRVYHFCAILEGSGYSNLVRFYIDGVEQTSGIPTNRQPGSATLSSRGVAEFGDPAGTVGVNGTALLMQSPGDNRTTEQVINAYYQHWFAFGDTASAALTATQVRDTLFEKGALPDITIAAGTESAMQTSLDAYASTLRADAPLCIRVSTVTGDGDLTLDANNITFSPLASIHVQYMGTGTLTWKNSNGGDASIGSVPNGGTITFVKPQTLTVTAKDASDQSAINGARVYLEADTGGLLPAGDSVTITRSATTATVTHTAHGLSTGDTIAIRGANQPEYNDIKTITVTGVNTYTFTVSGSPVTPATGTITATAVVMNTTTNVSGVATGNFNYISDQLVTGRIRKGTSSTYYKTAILSETLTSTALNMTTLMVKDE